MFKRVFIVLLFAFASAFAFADVVQASDDYRSAQVVALDFAADNAVSDPVAVDAAEVVQSGPLVSSVCAYGGAQFHRGVLDGVAGRSSTDGRHYRFNGGAVDDSENKALLVDSVLARERSTAQA